MKFRELWKWEKGLHSKYFYPGVWIQHATLLDLPTTLHAVQICPRGLSPTSIPRSPVWYCWWQEEGDGLWRWPGSQSRSLAEPVDRSQVGNTCPEVKVTGLTLFTFSYWPKGFSTKSIVSLVTSAFQTEVCAEKGDSTVPSGAKNTHTNIRLYPWRRACSSNVTTF